MSRALVVTVVHVPLDARIHHREIRALRGAGFDVTYAAPWSGYGIDRSQVADGVEAVDVPRSIGRDRWASVRAINRLLHDRGEEFDIIVLHDPELLASAARLIEQLPPVVWDVHEDTAASLTDRPWIPDWARPAVVPLVRAAERWAENNLRIILAEDGYRELFQSEHPVVHNYPYVPKEPPVPPGDDRVVYVGRVSRKRGARELVETGRRLKGEVTVEIAGPADSDVRDLLQDANERSYVKWHGFVPNDEALSMVRGALAGLSLLHDEPNYRNSLPTKVLEYLSRGVPVVTTPLPEPERIVHQADAGLVVPFEDVDETVQAVRSLRTESERRRGMAERGHRLVAEQYSWDVEGPRFAGLLAAWARS